MHTPGIHGSCPYVPDVGLEFKLLSKSASELRKNQIIYCHVDKNKLSYGHPMNNYK